MERDGQPGPEVQKPAVLYHASQQRDIRVFEPRAEKVRDPLEGPVIFATPDKAYASCFLIPWTDSWVKLGRYGQGEPWKMVVSDRARFEAADAGGVIYELPSTHFRTDPTKNMAGTEWVSREAVEPSGGSDYQSGLDAMVHEGVEVYFVDEPTWAAIRDSADHGEAVVAGLTAYVPDVKR